MVRYLIIVTFALITHLGFANNGKPFVIASVNKSTVFVEQPVKVTLTVYTSTWFTSPLQIDNLQVDGAFIQSFKRTQSSIKYIDKNKYATLEFYYIVFPYKEGQLTIPALNIKVESPPEGDYRGVQSTIQTKPLTIHIAPVPENADQDKWLVATNASISNRWSIDLKKLKVGDVLKRTITTTANGTLPSFIDEAEVKEVDFAKIYSSAAQFVDLRDNVSANGKRIDSYSYLIEEEGVFTIPPVEISWYNPYLGKSYKRQLPAYEVKVAPNPEMASLQILSDSLRALNALVIDQAETKEELWSKEKIVELSIYALVAVIVLWLLVKIVRILIRSMKRRIAHYKNGEAFWYRKVAGAKTNKEIITQSYQWLDHSQDEFGAKQLSAINTTDKISHLKESIYAKHPKGSVSMRGIKKTIGIWRKKQLKKSNTIQKDFLTTDIN